MTGCNQNAVVLTNASPEEVAQQGGSGLRPGMWETKVEIQSAAIGGMAEVTREQAKAQGRDVDQVRTACVSEEEAKRPVGDMITGETGGKCTYRHYRTEGGKVDLALSCPGPDGKEAMTLKASGTYAADAVALDTEMTVGGAGGMRMKSKTTMHRTGDCPK